MSYPIRKGKVGGMFDPKLPPINLLVLPQWSDVLKYRNHIKEKPMDNDYSNLYTNNNTDVSTLISKITKWHWKRNLIEGSTDKDQFAKLIQEAGELSDNICKGRNITDDIGDMIVVLINIAERNSLTIEECLQEAWNDIKNRKGKMVDGIFIKE